MYRLTSFYDIFLVARIGLWVAYEIENSQRLTMRCFFFLGEWSKAMIFLF